MNKKIIISFLLSLMIIIMISFSSFFFNEKTIVSEEKNIELKIDEIMKTMSIEEKIAQMLVLYYNSDIVDQELTEILKTYSPGGFILTKNNLTSLDSAINFVKDIKENSKIPPIIAIDEEGGTVHRLDYIDGTSPFPDMRDLGKTEDKTIAYNLGKAVAEELRVIGVNVNFAPVMDIDNGKTDSFMRYRSISTNKEIVSSLGTSFAKGLEDNKIIATYKHFPGHGDTSVDSHTNMPIINKTKEEIMNNELIPFKEAIKNDAKLIMTAHINIPSISKYPATLSKELITDILKKELGYKGLVITDALNMGAITNNFTEEEIYTKAIEAGCDILLMPTSSKSAINIIKRNISQKRIDESVKKILLFKYTYLNNDNLLNKSVFNNESHKDVINKIKSYEN